MSRGEVGCPWGGGREVKSAALLSNLKAALCVVPVGRGKLCRTGRTRTREQPSEPPGLPGGLESHLPTP